MATRCIRLVDEFGTHFTHQDVVAGRTVLSSSSLGVFDLASTGGELPVASVSSPRQWLRATSGFIGGRLRHVRLQSTTNTLHADFADLGRLDVDLSTLTSRTSGFVDRDSEAEALLGPGLLLPLAADACFALHASSVAMDGNAVLLLGPSGSGKSSIARYACKGGALALADDVVPLDIADSAYAQPRFPQLKWVEPLAVADQRVRIGALVFVTRGAPALEIFGVAPATTVAMLIRDTVAARLFGASLLAGQLREMTRLANLVPSCRLHWPECAPVDFPVQCERAVQLIRRIG